MPRPLSDWQDEIAAGILEDLEEIAGVSIGEMMADEIEALAEVEEEYEVFPVYEEPTESEELDLDNDYDSETSDYFNELFDDLDVDADEEIDAYGDD